jgi:CelD/BcsL family acetyltransferase involved in cellulose biosynthesis
MPDSNINKNIAEMATITEQVYTAPKDIQTEVFEDFDKLAALQPEWDSFVETVGGEIFLTYDWCRIWWKYYGKKRTLRVFIFRNHGALVGIIPLFFETIWLGPVRARAAKVVGTDFTISQISLPIQSAFVPIVIERLFAEMCSTLGWDIICIGPLAGQYQDCDVLYQACRRSFSSRWQVEKVNVGVHTYFELADSWEKYLSGLTNKQKDELKRNYSLLARTVGLDVNQISIRTAQEDTLDEMFTNFVYMHQLHWKELGKLGHFGDWPDSEAFHREVAQVQLAHGRLRLMEVSFGDRCLGYEYSFKCGRKYINSLGARSISEQLAHVSVGKITFGEMVKSAISEGVNCIDSSQGKYEHKLRLGGKLFPIHKIWITPRNRLARFRIGVFRLLVGLLNLGYYKIWFGRVAPKLPFKRGCLWKIWIRTRGLM